MIFRQYFDSTSYTYTYLLASRVGGEAMIIDPVIEKTDLYLRALSDLNLKLVKAVDTHCHADHITALGSLRDATHCVTVMGREALVDLVSMRVDDGDMINIENISLNVMHTPGHTNDSYCFFGSGRIFTGDTLLIRSTGRTDFQNGNPYDAYDSLFNKVLKLPDETLVYPGHDYKGETVSTIGEEKNFNPRLQISSAGEYANIMDNLNLSNPKMMDEAIPANRTIGYNDEDCKLLECTLNCEQVQFRLKNDELLLVDLREDSERERDGIIPDSLHTPYHLLKSAIKPGGLIHTMKLQTAKPLLLYCAYGERSALALKEIQDAGFTNSYHLAGGIDAWSQAKAILKFPD